MRTQLLLVQTLQDLTSEKKLKPDVNGALMLPEAEQFEDHLKPPDPVPPEDEFVNDGHHTDVQVHVSC